MNVRLIVSTVAGTGFLASLFLPMFEGRTRLDFLRGCLEIATWRYPYVTFGKWLYWTAFILGDIVFVIAVLHGFLNRKSPGWLIWSLFGALGIVLSWLGLALHEYLRAGPWRVGSGYIIWLAAFLSIIAVQEKRPLLSRTRRYRQPR